MGKAWIENLATEIQDKGRDAAESYGRDQHRAGVVASEGKIFFTALVFCLEQDMSDLRSQLQGSVVSCETSVVKESPTGVRLSRSRFPWFDAVLKHGEGDIAFEYAHGRGVSGDLNLLSSGERKMIHFVFDLDAQDKLSVIESFGSTPRRFDQPEELAKYIMELLFKV